MIEFATENTKPLVRDMWRICFEDTEEFMDLHFSRKYKPQNTLIYFEDGVAAASLQMFEYSLRFYGNEIPFYYLAGLCTLPEHRKKGYMAQLIYKAHEAMSERGIPLSILVPAENWLFGFYEKYGYEHVFEGGGEVPLKAILERSSDLQSAYRYFDKRLQSSDLCVLKTYDDFLDIIEESRQDGFPPKYNLSGMARVMDIPYLLNIYALSLDEETVFTLAVEDDERTLIYKLSHAGAELCATNTEPVAKVDIRLLCRLLFGYKTSELPSSLFLFFSEHRAVMNLMME